MKTLSVVRIAGLAAAAFACACAGTSVDVGAARARAESGDVGAVRDLVAVVRRTPFRYDDKTEQALDGLCRLKGSGSGFDALRRQYEFLEGVDKGQDRVEACLLQASSTTVFQSGARDWYEEAAHEVTEARNSKPSLFDRGFKGGPATRYEADKVKYERLEKLAVVLSKVLDPHEAARLAAGEKREKRSEDREKDKPAVVQAIKDWLLLNNRLGTEELVRLESGEGVFRADIQWQEGVEPPAADVSLEMFLPFRGAGQRPGPQTLNLRLRAERFGDRWAIREQ